MKPDWKKEIEDYFDNMTEDDFQQLLIDSNFEYYQKFKCFCMFYNVDEGCTWTPDFVEWIDCCPINRGNVI